MFETIASVVVLIVVLSIWELIWKGISLWKCGRNNQLAWFVAILILNTAGVLPIIYLIFFQKRKMMVPVKKMPVKRKTSKKRRR